jgi:hypothetical protein
VGRVYIHLITYLEDEFGLIGSDYLLNLLKCNDQNVKTKFILFLYIMYHLLMIQFFFAIGDSLVGNYVQF